MSDGKKEFVFSSASSSSARSLDDDDNVPMAAASAAAASAAAARGIVYDPHAVKLCASLLSLFEQLKKLAARREEAVSRFAEKPGADIYEVSFDHTRGGLSVSCLQETVEGLDAATTEARENLAHEIAQRKADITGLEAEAAKLGKQIQDSQGEGTEAIALQLCSMHAMIGKHRQALKELEGKSELEVKVQVQRVKTCVELLKTETSSVAEQEVRMVPRRDAGIYVLGGEINLEDENSYMSTVERYDVKQNRWEAVVSMNHKRSGGGSVVLDGTVCAIGGHDGKAHVKSIERFSPKSGCWQLVTPFTFPAEGCAVGVLNDRLYVAGGAGAGGILSSVMSFEAKANRTQQLASMTSRRIYAAGAVLDGFFYVVGGTDGKGYFRTVERYNPASFTWELVAPMNRNRSQCAAAACNGHLYALGGIGKSQQSLSSVERYDPRIDKWEELATMQQKRRGLAAVALDGRLYVMGGTKLVDAVASVERYDPATNRWELVAPMASARAFASAAVAM